MTAMVSVVSGGAVVNLQQLASVKGGRGARIGAVKGARYMLAEMSGGPAAGEITIMRHGKALLIEQNAEGAEPASVIIEDFYGSEGQLVGVAADGEYVEYLAATASGDVDIAGMAEDAGALVSMRGVQSATQPRNFQFAEGGASAFSGALAGLAAVGGGFVLSGHKGGEGGSGAQAAPAARGFAVAEDVALAVADVQDSVADAVPAADALLANDEVLPDRSVPVDGSEVEIELASAAGDNKIEAGPNTLLTEATVKAGDAMAAPFADFVPTIEAILDDQGLIQGIVADGGYTDDGRPQIVGKADVGVLVHIYRGVELIGQVYADASGEWSFTPKLPLSDGRHSISILHEYPDGDVSESSLPYVIFVDKSVPDAPVITGMYDDEGRITGTISEGAITDDNRPTIEGTAEAHATVVVYDKGKEIGRTQVDADGKWSFTPEPALADGLHILSYAAVDRAGNGSERTAVSEFIVDTRPEKVNIYYAEDDAGSVTGEVFSGGVTDDSTPTLFGTATAGGIVKIYEGSVLLGEVVADVDGTWQFTPETALSEGSHSLHATVTLVAKGESAPSKLFKLEVDLTAPSEPSIDTVLDDAGAEHGVVLSGQSTDDATPTLSGTAEKGSMVSIFANGVLLGSTVADAGGQWIFTPTQPLQDGAYAFTVNAADAAGNNSASSSVYQINIDTLRPDAPTIDSVYDDVGDEQGALQNGGRTDDTQPAFAGKAEANSTVIIRDSGVEIGRVQADAAGNWSFTPELALISGAHAITAVSVDAAGNASLPSEAFKLTVSLVPAVAPSIESIHDDVGLAQGALSSGAVTDDDMPLISGKAEPNAMLVLIDNGVELARVQVDASGHWSYQPATPLSKGVHNLLVTELDAQGNAGLSSGIFGFRVVELGGVGGFENFSEMPVQNSLANGGAVVLASGVVISGSYLVAEYVYNGSSATGIRPDDINRSPQSYNDGLISLELPTESAKVSFSYIAQSAGSNVRYFDVNGEMLGEFSLGASQSLFGTRVSFQAPEGKLIASIEVRATTVNGGSSWDYITIDALQWGERYPTGISISTAETDDSGSRIVYGSVAGMPYLLPDMVVEVSTDGGKTWTEATFAEGSWAAIQMGMPKGNWTAEVRIAERSSGLSLGISDVKAVLAVSAKAPAIARIVDAEGMYTAAKAADGSLIEVSLEGTGAKQGDRVHVRWGTVTYDQVLTKADIDAGQVTVKMPADQILLQGVTNDFTVTAQIIAKGGAIGAVSQPYDVVGTYVVSAAKTDSLQQNPVSNAYKGTGFTVSTGGVMAKTGLTVATYAGLTLTDESRNANALFKLDAPAREFTIRLSGIDSEQGVKIQIFDAKGNFIEEQTIYGDSSSFHASTYTYSSKHELVDIGSFKLIASEASVTVDGFIRKDVTHTVDVRDPYIISSSKENFFGSDADEVVTITMDADRYFAGLSQGMGIHGGGGVDTLRINDRAQIPIHLGVGVSSMEVIELHSSQGAQKHLHLNVADVLRNGGTDVFYTGENSRLQMMVNCVRLDSFRPAVTLSDQLPGGFSLTNPGTYNIGGDVGDWMAMPGILTIDGKYYTSYQHSGLDIEVLVQSGVNVILSNRKEYVPTGTEVALSTATLVEEVLVDSTNFYTAGDDEIIARTGYADRISGGAGNDTIRNVGTGDVVHAGSGDDTVFIVSSDFAQLDGGRGIDTLVMDGQSIHVDLSAIGQKVQGFEKFDLGEGGNALSLRIEDLLADGARDLLLADGKIQMLVGGASGEVNLLGGGEDWKSVDSIVVSGVSYNVYGNHAGTAELLVEDMLRVTIL